MVVFKETVRYFAEEQPNAGYGRLLRQLVGNWQQCNDAGLGSWSATITIVKASLLVYNLYDFENYAGGSDCGYYLRLRSFNGSILDYAIAGASAELAGDPADVNGIYWLSQPGTYVFWVMGFEVENGECKLGITNFSDIVGLSGQVCVDVEDNTWTKVFDRNIIGVRGELRDTCLGTLKKHVVRLNVNVICDQNDLDGSYRNRGESPPAEQWWMDVYLNDEWETWVASHKQFDNLDFGGSNQGEFCFLCDINEIANVKLYLWHNEGTTIEFCVTWSLIGCPWISCDCYADPVLINIPQNSTVNLLAEPLDGDVTKYLGLGTVKAVQGGAITQVYDEVSGTGIQDYSGRLTVLPAQRLSPFHRGFRSCISVIAADRRG